MAALILAITLCLGSFHFAVASVIDKQCIVLSLSDHLEGSSDDGDRYHRLWSWLRQPSVDGASVIAFLSQDPKLRELFSRDAGVGEKYTVEQHTLRVFDLLKEQLPRFALDTIHTPEGTDLPSLLKMIVVLHDIGKGEAVKVGKKAQQHAYTLPILVETMSKLGFSKAEVDIARAIVDNDILGDLLKPKGTLSPEEAFHKLSALAAQTSLKPEDYFRLQLLFYTADAGSYPTLRKNVFADTLSGRIVPVNSKYDTLARLFEKDPTPNPHPERTDPVYYLRGFAKTPSALLDKRYKILCQLHGVTISRSTPISTRRISAGNCSRGCALAGEGLAWQPQGFTRWRLSGRGT